METKKTALKPADFVHLHNHSQYSLLDGLTKLPALVEYVKKTGMESIALTDHGTMSGAIEFYKACRAKDLKPIIGMEAYIAPRTFLDKDPSHDRQNFHLTLLAMNQTGYQNLMRLSSLANLEGFYYRPRIDRQLLEKYNEGLIVLSGCIGSEVSDALRQGQYEQAKKIAEWYKSVFGDRYYIELMDHGHTEHPKSWQEQTDVNQDLLKIAQELKIDAVLTCDAHYLMHDDQEAHEILLCVQTGAFLSDEQRFSLRDFELHVADPKDIIKRWGKTHPELLANTAKIAARCAVEIDLGKILIPKFPISKGETEKSLLEEYVWKGLAWRYGGKSRQQAFEKLKLSEAKKLLDQKIVDQAEYELSIVDKMGFNGYFLIVQDFINWGKDRGIVFGPGRGSAAGSILAYALRITEVDPLEYELMFERFLNPDRISMPDMDIDIQDSRREEVINYCIEKYGRDQVANIVTFGRMAARNSVRDVARVLQVPYAEADRLAKMIPPPVQGRHIPLKESLKANPDLKNEYASNEQSQRVFDLAMKLEGTIRSHGVHAAGVVIAPDELVKFTPLEMAQKGSIATQYSMGPIEELGLLKMDFLGLSNLTIIKNALRIIKKVYGKNIDINTIPLDDQKAFELLQRGETIGVFQLESAGMTRYLKQLKPNQFTDIIAVVALYRPGPMAEFPRFIEGKNEPSKITYPHSSLEPILKDTYGVIVFQEQIIALLQMIAGYTASEADLVRKAIGKKQRDIMRAEEPRFIKGCIAQGLTKSGAERLWSLIQPFADYSFNKAHAACYGLIAYQTAYLKANFSDAFMAALMTSDFDNTDRLAIEITACKKMGIDVLPPDINESFHEFGILGGQNQIRFGLDAIKNVGHGAVDEIIRAREAAGGRLESLNDYAKYVSCRIVNRKALESLVKAGALDAFGERSLLINNIDNILNVSQRLQKESDAGQVNLFGETTVASVSPSISLEPGEPISPQQILGWERELLGIYLSDHPLAAYKDILAARATSIASLSKSHDGRLIKVGGSINQIREITTRNGSKMAFIKVADLAGETELIVFPKTYIKTADIWIRDNVIIVKAKVDFSRNDELKLLVEDVQLISEEEARNFDKSKELPIDEPLKQRLYIRLEDSSNQPQLLTLKKKLDGYSGDTEVVLVTGAKESKQIIKLPQTISISEESLRELASIFGSTNVVVR